MGRRPEPPRIDTKETQIIDESESEEAENEEEDLVFPEPPVSYTTNGLERQHEEKLERIQQR